MKKGKIDTKKKWTNSEEKVVRCSKYKMMDFLQNHFNFDELFSSFIRKDIVVESNNNNSFIENVYNTAKKYNVFFIEGIAYDNKLQKLLSYHKGQINKSYL